MGKAKDEEIVQSLQKYKVATDAHYLKQEDRYIHKAYLNSKGGERETDLFYEYSYLQDENDIRKNLEPSEIDVDKCFDNSMEMFDKIEIYDLLHSQTIPSVPIKNYPKKEMLSPLDYETRKELFPEMARMFNSDDNYERYWVNECWNELKNKKLDDTKEKRKKYYSELEEEARVKKVIGEKLGTNMFTSSAPIF